MGSALGQRRIWLTFLESGKRIQILLDELINTFGEPREEAIRGSLTSLPKVKEHPIKKKNLKVMHLSFGGFINTTCDAPINDFIHRKHGNKGKGEKISTS